MNNLKKIVIIGAGQIGSRHLQGVLRASNPLEIFVVDPFENSLEIAKERAGQVENKGHIVTYMANISNLPHAIDVAIIATSSNVRESVIQQLIASVEIKYLILEKILFQSVDSYLTIPSLLAEKGIITWVNLPMRTYGHFNQLKAVLAPLNERMSFNVVGSNWRIGCNAIHYIDLFEYLSDSKVIELNSDWLDTEIVPSKRVGFVEFTGTLKGQSDNKSTFMISSFPGEFGDGTIFISTASHRFVIQEGKNSIVHHLENNTDFKTISKTYFPEYQSTLTGDYIKEIFETGNCSLPKLNDITHTHKFYIEAFLSFYNGVSNSDVVLCPIT